MNSAPAILLSFSVSYSIVVVVVIGYYYYYFDALHMAIIHVTQVMKESKREGKKEVYSRIATTRSHMCTT
jgi:hypothetical protein